MNLATEPTGVCSYAKSTIANLSLHSVWLKVASLACNYQLKERNLWKIMMGLVSALQMKSRWESNINVLFGISFSLKPNKKLTTRINCFYLWSVIYQIGNLYVGNLCELTAQSQGRADNCHQTLLDSRSLPFSPLLRLSRKFSYVIQENRDSK